METGFIFFRRNQNRTETGLQASCILTETPKLGVSTIYKLWVSFLIKICV